VRLEEYDVLADGHPDAAAAENLWELWQETLLALVQPALLGSGRRLESLFQLHPRAVGTPSRDVPEWAAPGYSVG
jgi:hypothetical protein